MNDLPGLIKQCHRDSQRWFPNIADDPIHHALSLCGEAGEVANILKKVQRGSIDLDAVREALGEEAVDTLIYLCNLLAVLEVDVVKVYREKRAKNELRFGSGSLTDLLDLRPGGRTSGAGQISCGCSYGELGIHE